MTNPPAVRTDGPDAGPVDPAGALSDRDRLHTLLLGLAGRVPDDGLALMRTFLADDDEAELAVLLSGAVESGALPLLAGEERTIREFLTYHGFGMSPRETHALLPPPGVRFAPSAARGDDDLIDEGLPERVAQEVGDRLVGLRSAWRAWRTLPAAQSTEPAPDAPTGTPNPFSGEVSVADPRRPARVFLFEADGDADLVELTAEIQQWLAEIGEEPPRVEVFGPGTELSAYHEAALSGGALLWSAEPVADPRLARVFDGADPGTGPYFHPDHPRTDDADRERLLAYLTAADAVLATPGTMDDVVDAGRGAVVPLTFRSDGVWIWPDAVAYYVREHGLAPEPDLAAHIRSADGPPAPLSRLSRLRVMAVLIGPQPAASS
ncbi:hypothetical protein [Cryptosporangium japonicum]|uniref:Uncharacterized protein n=1 Tax=Cryptosporangium japonicum TaxID=80872 RepID=A0ABP3DTD4_9ACTN